MIGYYIFLEESWEYDTNIHFIHEVSNGKQQTSMVHSYKEVNDVDHSKLNKAMRGHSLRMCTHS